ncbi:penicillin-binding protein [Corallococcus sp. M34]|uniref:penicillin-binding transpeptidase domain-containing protein n=1 Tax=Citreicoccus inhibens TaxID=2849499 RepID=UPI001C21791C|nr:penicillin-binding transpeptidase domain-containing protein [Citreicoccus inhibens]MBU8898086.1 penicillin-binding protein [Citreicoccus inhibens]
MSRRTCEFFFGVIAALALGACATVRPPPPPPPPGPADAAQAYLQGWSAGDLTRLRAAVVAPPEDFEAQHARFRDGLRIIASRFELGDVTWQGESAVARFRAYHWLRGLGEWPVEGALRLTRREGRWWVRWTPAVLHPDLQGTERFSRTRAWGARGELLDDSGRSLTHIGDVITIGVNPARVRSRAAVASALEAQLGVAPERMEQVLGPAGAAVTDGFVPVIDVRPERYQLVRPALAPVPGIFFRRKSARLTPAEGFAAHTLGRVGDITAEALAQLGPLYQPGDVVGLSGLERAYERRLAGSPSGDVLVTRAAGDTRVLFHFEGTPGAPLPTTLRPDVQAAAEAALEGVVEPAALVAVDSTTGAIVALVSRPLAQPAHRALTGRYPPGSTFKIVTTEALLAEGLEPRTAVACPPTVTVGGRTFRNFEDEFLGTTSLRLAFAHSCNTAYVALAEQLGQERLAAAARRFGFEVPYRAGLPTPGASFPAPRDVAELASAAIGQGRVLATPLHLASVGAAVAAGQWRAPYLVKEQEPRPREALAPGTAGPLAAMMRAVVTEGTGRALASVPGAGGKTGTAEFGTTPPLPTHAWFVGFHAGLGFAVLVEGGGVGGRVAAPIAARFASAVK